ncbi:unnamed protein product [Cochlearia groenlandica]
MQDLSSTVSFSPSFSFYVSDDVNTVEAAVRVVQESQSYYSVETDGEDGTEFEFETSPLREESFFHFPTTTTTAKLKLSSEDDDVATDPVTTENLLYGGWSIDRSQTSPSRSESSSDSEDSENHSPSNRRYYCFWGPIRSPTPARGDRSKSKSPIVAKRCSFKDLLRRSHSDGSVATASESRRCRFKDLLRRSFSDGRGRGGDVSPISTSGDRSPVVVKEKHKTASYNKTTSVGEVDKRRKSYLPYRQDLIGGVFAGMSRFRH